MNPNIVLLTVDCLRYDRIGCYGYNKELTPHIDELAADGLRWEQCYSTGPRTNESFPGIVSSALSADCGYAGEVWHRTPPAPTLGSWLADNGYETVSRVANPQLAEMKGYDYGMNSHRNLSVDAVGWGFSDEEATDSENDEDGSIIDALPDFGSAIYDIRTNVRSAGRVARWTVYTPMFYLYREYQRRSGWPTIDGADVAEEINSTLEPTSTENEPIFRWAHFNDIHAPIHPARVDAAPVGDLSTRRQYNADIRRISQEPTADYEEIYDAMVAYEDAQIGAVLEKLKLSNLWDNTIVIVTADHGEALYDRGVHGHASGNDRYLHDESRDYMYDELLRVPLVIGGGAVESPGTISTPVSTAWLNEVIAELTGIERGAFVWESGRESHIHPSEEAIVLADALTDKGHTFAAIRGTEKIVTQSLHPDDDVRDGALYFDLAADPEEQSPIDAEEAPEALFDAIRGNIIRQQDLEDTSPSADVSEGTKELLSQLGYTEQ